MNAAMLKVGGSTLACLLLVALAGWFLMRSYDLEMSVKDVEWQARWNARDDGDK